MMKNMIINSIPSQKLTRFFFKIIMLVVLTSILLPGPFRNLIEAIYSYPKNELTRKILLIIKPIHSLYIKNPCYAKNKTTKMFLSISCLIMVLLSCCSCPMSIELCFVSPCLPTPTAVSLS